MPRRTPYTRVVTRERARPRHVVGMGDVVFKGFQCLNPECEEFIFVRKNQLGSDFEIACPKCGAVLRAGDSTKIYEYDVVRSADSQTQRSYWPRFRFAVRASAIQSCGDCQAP